jgi:hypothetical protein
MFNDFFCFDSEFVAHGLSALCLLATGVAAVLSVGPKAPTQKRMSYKQWLSIPDMPIQRDTPSHADEAWWLETLCEAHFTVHMVVLPDGTEYKADGHTRTYMWVNDMTDRVPEYLNVQVHYARDMEHAKQIYKQYDGSGQTKNAGDQLFSTLKEFGVPMTSKFFKNGSGLVSSIKEAYRHVCRAYGIEITKEIKRAMLELAIEFFKPQLAALDGINPKTCRKNGPNFKGPVSTSFILAHFKYSELGKRADEVVDFFDRYNKDLGCKSERKYDAVHSVTVTMTSGSGGGEGHRTVRTAAILGALERWLDDGGKKCKYVRLSSVDLNAYLSRESARKTSIAQLARFSNERKKITR